jgi:tetratricopeptide (TPR) repeat protein
LTAVLKDIATGLAVCLVCFGLVEGALRLAGRPSVDKAVDPYVGFSSIRPLFEVKNGSAFTSPSRLRYFNEVSFPVAKAPGTMRIFAFGGSTTYGHPFDQRTAFPRWLEEFLKASCPDRNIEVINAGGISYASYRITPLVRESLGLGADIVVLFTGHNEFLERRTYRGMFAQGRLVTIRSLLENLRVYQALRLLLEPLLPTVADRKSGDGSSAKASSADRTTLRDEVAAILDVSGGLDQYHRDDEFTRGVVDHFAYNLRRIIQLCETARVPVILVEPESNLKDFSPFKSEYGLHVSLDSRKTIASILEKVQLRSPSIPAEETVKALDEAVRLDSGYADSYFARGRALVAAGRYPEAHEDFLRAKDLDICPLRAVGPILEVIRNTARDFGIPLIRLKDVLAPRMPSLGNLTGIPGDESFLDHVHPTIESHQALAEAILDSMIRRGIVNPSIALSASDRKELYEKVMSGMDERFMALRDLNLAKTLRWAGKKDQARKALDRAAAVMKDSAEIHKMRGGFLLEDRDFDGALREYRTAVELSGDDPDMVFSLAVALNAAGRREEAIERYERLVAEKVDIPEAYSNPALMLLEAGRVDEARKTLEEGLAHTGESAAIFAAMGLTEAVSGNPTKGAQWMRRAIAAEPGNPNHLYNLAGMLAVAGDREAALRHIEEAAAKGYRKPDHALSDPVFSSIRHEPRFIEAVKRMR